MRGDYLLSVPLECRYKARGGLQTRVLRSNLVAERKTVGEPRRVAQPARRLGRAPHRLGNRPLHRGWLTRRSLLIITGRREPSGRRVRPAAHHETASSRTPYSASNADNAHKQPSARPCTAVARIGSATRAAAALPTPRRWLSRRGSCGRRRLVRRIGCCSRQNGGMMTRPVGPTTDLPLVAALGFLALEPRAPELEGADVGRRSNGATRGSRATYNDDDGNGNRAPSLR